MENFSIINISTALINTTKINYNYLYMREENIINENHMFKKRTF